MTTLDRPSLSVLLAGREAKAPMRFDTTTMPT